MTEQEFIETAKNGGYATLPVIKTYIATFGKTEYTDDDLISVHRLNEWRYNAEHQCKDCTYCICVYCGKRHVYKCKKMGISDSAAMTDTKN